MALVPQVRNGGLVIEQSAGDRLLWRLDWTEWLSQVGASALSVASWTAADGLTIEAAALDGNAAQVWVSGGEPGRTYWLRCVAESVEGHRSTRELSVSISLSLSSDGGIFGTVGAALALFRHSLSTVSANVLPQDLPDAVAWQRLQASVAEVQGALGVPLRPTLVLPNGTPAPEGEPVMFEAGYDAPPDFFAPSRFGALQLRVRPVIAVESIEVVPPGAAPVMHIPPSWVRIDKKYGLLHLVPDGVSMSMQYGALGTVSALAGFQVPLAIRVRYRAGIDVLHPDYAAVLDAVIQSATLRVLRGAVTPTSSSVSADGLSQSSSIDVDRLSSDLEDQIGALRQKLLGPLWGVL